jgi:hypothetical protein
MYTPMITIHLKGGLGNQLFQIFATIAYSLEYNHEFIFPYADKLHTGMIRPTYWSNLLKSLIVYTAANPSCMFLNSQIHQLPVLREPGFQYEKIPRIDPSKSVALDGYYQSFKYFEKYEAQIYQMIDLENQQTLAKGDFNHYLGNVFTICMHFRLGDYKYKQEYHPVMPKEYYEKSLHAILSSSASPARVLYFCEQEDNEYVNQMIHYLKTKTSEYTIEFVKVDDTIEDWKQMLLMSCCDSHIIANSSYSWWGAYLSQNANKQVCYPSKWFGPGMGNVITKDLFPSNWKKIDI